MTPVQQDGSEKKATAGRRTLSGVKQLLLFVAGAATAILAATAGGWVTDGYADRQRELELEASLLSEISRESVRLYAGGRRLASAKESSSAISQQHQRVLDGWRYAGAEIDPVFSTYFPGNALVTRWQRYKDALFSFGLLACCEGGEARGKSVGAIRKKYIRRYRGTEPFELNEKSWEALTTEPAGSRKRSGAYKELGRYLLREQANLGREIQDSHPQLD